MPADKGKLKLANPKAVLKSVEGLFDLKGYPTPYSDVVAQLVLAHQTQMTNLITRTGWEARLLAAKPSTDASARVAEAARDLVDYLLFIDEAPLTGPVKGGSGFTERFAKDRTARQAGTVAPRLRSAPPPVPVSVQLHDLHAGVRRHAGAGPRRGVRPDVGRVVGAREAARATAGLSLADRRAIVEILRATEIWTCRPIFKRRCRSG